MKNVTSPPFLCVEFKMRNFIYMSQASHKQWELAILILINTSTSIRFIYLFYFIY